MPTDHDTHNDVFAEAFNERYGEPLPTESLCLLQRVIEAAASERPDLHDRWEMGFNVRVVPVMRRKAKADLLAELRRYDDPLEGFVCVYGGVE